MVQNVELARRTRRTAILDRRHVPRNVTAVATAVAITAATEAGTGAVVPLAVHLRYRSVSGNSRIRILTNVNNASLHSAAYLLIHGRHCRRTVVAPLVPKIIPSCYPFAHDRLSARSMQELLADLDYAIHEARCTAHADCRHTGRPGSCERRF